MPKQRVIELYLNNTFEEKKISYDVNKLKPRKKDEVEFEPICVFHERKKRFLRKPRKLVLYVNGAKKALRFAKVTDEMQTLWTKEEATEHVHKEMSKAHEARHPMTMWEFGVIIAILMVIILVNIKIALFFGVF